LGKILSRSHFARPPTIGISAVEETKCFAKNVKGDLIDNPNGKQYCASSPVSSEKRRG
jgi:hypothetical protein